MPKKAPIASSPDLKVCSKCSQEKPFTAFYRNRTELSGYNTQCKDCHRETRLASYKKRKQNPYPPSMTGNKVCSSCSEDFVITEFYADPLSIDGRNSRCKPCCRAATASWLSRADKQRLKERKQRWHLEHQELTVFRAKQYRIDHPEWARDANARNNRKRRAAKLNAPVNDLTAGEWKILLDEFAGLCAYCGKLMLEPTMDHVVPLSKGGSHTYDNIVPACLSCNSRKRASSADSFLRKLLNVPTNPLNTGSMVHTQLPALDGNEQLTP